MTALRALVAHLRSSQAQRSEDGSALIIALAFLALFALIVPATLSFASSGLLGTDFLRNQRSAIYADQAGLYAAVNAIRGSTSIGMGTNGQPCPSFPAGPYGPYEAQNYTVTVSCKVAGSGSFGSPNFPPDEFLALGSDPSEGVIVQPTNGNGGGNTSFQAVGPSASNSVIEFNANGGGPFTSIGNLTAVGACTNVALAPGFTENCSGGSANQQADPTYADAFTTFPAAAVLPASCPGGAVVFSPGYYSSAPTPPPGPGCNGKPLYFQPGNYYFDFTGPNFVWNLNGETVVGGTANGWDPNRAGSTPTLPGACKTDADPAPNDGVQFVFGGQTQLNVGTGNIELCAQPSTTSQEIAVFGLETSSPAPTTLVDTPTTTGDIGGDVNFTNKGNALSIDGAQATASIPSGNKLTTGIILNGYTGALPANALVSSITLRVAHSETSAINALQAKLTFTGGFDTFNSAATCGSGTTALCINSSLHEDDFDVTHDLLVHDPTLTGLNVQYTASVPHTNSPSSTAGLDGVVLSVKYALPGTFRAQSGCLVFTQSQRNGCPFITNSPPSSSTGDIYMHGTVYAPSGWIDTTTQQLGTGQPNPIQYNRGLIARDIEMEIHPGNGGNPAQAGAFDISRRRLLLTASVVSPPSQLPSLMSLVDIDDSTGPGANVTYLSWDSQK